MALRDRDKPVTRWALSLPQLWVVAAVALPMLALHGALGTIDLTYHLRAGEDMLSSQSIARSDTYSFTGAGLPWLDQQWGAQLFLAIVYRVTGWPGLSLAQILVGGAVFLFVYLACRAAGAATRESAWLTLASGAVTLTGLALRPQMFGAVLFSASLWVVLGRRAHPSRLWAMPAIVAVWANVHGSFVLGPLLLVLAWLQDRFDRVPRAERTLLAGVAAVAATLVNPFGVRVWSYVVDLSTNPIISRLVDEWQPPNVRGWDDLLFFLSVAGVGLIMARRGRPVPWPSLVALGLFLGLALMATRNVLWWGLAGAPIVAGILKDRPAGGGRELPRQELSPSLINTAIGGCIVLLVAVFFWLSIDGGSLRRPSPRVDDAPTALTAALNQFLQPGDRMFNAQRWGSWFEFALPEHPVFVDSRIEVFPSSVWNDYLDVSVGREGWQQILSRWRVRVVVAERGQQASMIPIIRRDPGWRLVYQDRFGFIFVSTQMLG